MIERISILGVGYLGFPLAQQLKQMGCKLKLSSTNAQKRQEFESLGLEAFDVKLDNPLESPGFFDCELLIFCLPPSAYPENYQDALLQMMALLRRNNAKILFTSSTSVYSDFEGIVNENSAISPKGIAGQKLLNTEEIVRSSGLQWSILRLGGLVGGSRHPIKYLSGRKDVKGGLHAVNLLHLEDAIACILHLIERGTWEELYNCCSSEHPRKKDYYTSMAKRYGLEPPTFDKEDLSTNKQVDCSKLLTTDFSFKFTDPYHYPSIML